MHRRSSGKEYWVFPGGGVEENETPEQAVLRELLEETSIETRIIRLLYHHHITGDLNDSDQYFYLCEYLSGEPKLGSANELKETLAGTDFYEPLWISVTKLPELLLFPLEIRDWLIEDLKNDWPEKPRTATFKVSELRKDL